MKTIPTKTAATTTTPEATTTEISTEATEKLSQDPYLTHYIPQSEHADFIQVSKAAVGRETFWSNQDDIKK